MNILYPQYITIPMNTAFHRQLISSFNSNIIPLALFPFLERYSTHCSHQGSFCPQISIFHLSGTMLHFHTELLDMHSSRKQPYSDLDDTFFHTITHHIRKIKKIRMGSHSSHTPSTCTHPVIKMCKLSSVSTFSHNCSSCSTVNPTFP